MRLSGIEIARTMLGLQEVRDKKQIRDFLKLHSVNGDINIDPSQIAWCAAFINATERASGGEPDGKLNARSFLKYGEKIPLTDAKEGDIVVFERGNDGWSGHVAYFIKYDHANNLVYVIGGNQSNRVCEQAYLKNHILGIRRG